MGQVKETVRIEAPLERVWEHLADFGGIAKWNPLLRGSRLLGEIERGVGAQRHCDIDPRGYTRERAVAWVEGTEVAWEVFETDMPMARARNGVTLQAAGNATLATFDLDYALKGGPFGSLMDVLMARRKMREAALRTLHGLKARAESKAIETVRA